MRSRLLLILGLGLLLLAGFLTAWASYSSGSEKQQTTTITTHGTTITVTYPKVKLKRIPGAVHVTTIRTQVPVTSAAHTVTRTISQLHTVKQVRTVTDLETVTVSRVQTVLQAQTVTVNQVETVTVKGNGNCPPPNPHCP